MENLDTDECVVKRISLICDEYSLKERLKKDVDIGVRSIDVIERSIERIPMYRELNTIKIETSHKSIEAVAKEIIIV